MQVKYVKSVKKFDAYFIPPHVFECIPSPLQNSYKRYWLKRPPVKMLQPFNALVYHQLSLTVFMSTNATGHHQYAIHLAAVISPELLWLSWYDHNVI